MEKYVVRMLSERNELREKCLKLRKFMRGDIFRSLPYIEQQFLLDQLYYMQGYLIAIENRIHYKGLI